MDYIKLWSIAFGLMVAQYFIGVFLLVGITRALQHFGLKRRIQKNWAPAQQYAVETVLALRALAINAFGYLVVMYLSFNGMFPYNPHAGAGDPWWRLVIDGLIMFLAHDAYFYWTHRMMHHKRLFRLFHLEHHLARTPTPLTSMRMSIPETVVQAGFFILWAYFMPNSPISFVVVLAYITFIGSVGHSGFEWLPFNAPRYPILNVFTSVTHHDLHHLGSYHSNYAIHFTFWDRLMGTHNYAYEKKITAMLAARRAGAAAST